MQVTDVLALIEKLYLTYGLPVIFFTSLLEITPLGWAIPGGTLLGLAGFFAYGRPYYLVASIVFGWFGAWTTFIVAYLLGAGAANKFNVKLKHNKKTDHAKLLLKKHGPVILTTSMMSGITRFWVAFAAGTQKYKFRRYIFYSGAASLTWTSLMVMVGYLAGSERGRLETHVASLGIISWILFFALISIVYLKIRKEFKEIQNEDSGN